jgi:hypothetical protein
MYQDPQSDFIDLLAFPAHFFAAGFDREPSALSPSCQWGNLFENFPESEHEARATAGAHAPPQRLPEITPPRLTFPKLNEASNSLILHGLSLTHKPRSRPRSELRLRREYIFPSESRCFRANVLGAWNRVWILALSDAHRSPGMQPGTNPIAPLTKEKK